MCNNVENTLNFLSNLDLKKVERDCKGKDTNEIINLLSKLAEEYCSNKIKIIDNTETVDLKITITKSEADWFLRECAKYIRNVNSN